MASNGSSSTHLVDILLVDDRIEDLLALEVILADTGVRLTKASSGAHALRYVLREDFAVILLDVTMPGMDGFEVAELIEKRERSRHVPIIFLTAEGRDVETIYRAYELGAVDFIMKPIDASVVKAKVAVFVELHRRGVEIQRQSELLQAVERQRREAELAELRGTTERRYRNLAEAIPQIVWTAEPGGDATYFNQRWTDHTGYSLAQSAGRGWQSAVHPNDAQRFVEVFERALAMEAPLRTECRLRSAVGSYRWHLCEALPERDHDHHLVGWLGTFTDVHEQKLLEEERARVLYREQLARAEVEVSLRRLEFLTEASSLLARSLDAQGLLTGLAELVTPRLCTWCVIDVLGADGALEQAAFAHEDEGLCALGAALGRRLLPDGEVSSGVHEKRPPEVSAAHCDARLLAEALGVEDADVVARLGAEAYVSVPLCARGQVLGAMTLVSARRERAYGPADVALAVDLGQRAGLAVDNARLYAGVQQAVRIRDEFLSIASHELRTPLSALELQAQSIQVQIGRRPLDVARLDAKAQVMERQVARLARLISQMLDVSRIQAGRLELDREEVVLAELVREVAARFAGEIERAESKLELSLDDGVVGRWDCPRLDQVVTNLLHNAIKYGQGGPNPDPARARRRGGRLEGAGPGHRHLAGGPPADLHRFERAVSSRQYGGMGVGLFIVAQIVTAHGGEIEVESDLGHGATFTARLPLEQPAA